MNGIDLQLICRVVKAIDPRDRPTITARTDHYFRTWCLYLCSSTFQNLTKQSNHYSS